MTAGPRSLRAQLALLAVSILLPALFCMAVLLGLSVRESRQSHERELLATARALSAAIDQDLATAAATNAVLATSDALPRGDYERMRLRALRAAGTRAWMALTDENGARIFDTGPGRGAAPRAQAPAPMVSVEPLPSGSGVSDLFDDPVAAQKVIAVRTPIQLGERRLTLSHIIDPARFLDLAAMRQISPPTMVTLVDRHHRIIARSRKHDQFFGASATGNMIRALRAAPEGIVRSRNLEGVRTVVAYTRSPTSGWSTLVVTPRDVFEAPMYRNMAGLVLVSLLILGFGSAVAFFYSRTISRELTLLQADATDVGHGRIVSPRQGLIRDFAHLQEALARASLELSSRSDRQRLMINELNHRVKNTLATVQSLAIQTFRSGDPEAPAKFDTRLAALASGHDLLTQTNWKDVDLSGVISRCAAPGDKRLSAQGPQIALSPQAALALCMVLHELTTNSLKYGALSSMTGAVSVEWAVDGERLTLTWKERGGPHVAAPRSSGFGTRLIDRLLRHELDGEASRTFDPEGMTFVARVSLAGSARWNNDFGV